MPAHAQQPSSPASPAAAVRSRASALGRPECRRLRTAIVESEQSERRVRAALIESVQHDLLILRKRYRQLGCQAGART